MLCDYLATLAESSISQSMSTKTISWCC